MLWDTCSTAGRCQLCSLNLEKALQEDITALKLMQVIFVDLLNGHDRSVQAPQCAATVHDAAIGIAIIVSMQQDSAHLTHPVLEQAEVSSVSAG